MEILQIKECIGYTKDDAFKYLNFDPNHPLIKGTNCTQAWTHRYYSILFLIQVLMKAI